MATAAWRKAAAEPTLSGVISERIVALPISWNPLYLKSHRPLAKQSPWVSSNPISSKAIPPPRNRPTFPATRRDLCSSVTSWKHRANWNIYVCFYLWMLNMLDMSPINEYYLAILKFNFWTKKKTIFSLSVMDLKKIFLQWLMAKALEDINFMN